MGKMFIYISFVMMFALQFVASAQNDVIEVSLNKYEELCAQCLDMKSKVAAGEVSGAVSGGFVPGYE